jgi:hypothetical protein
VRSGIFLEANLLQVGDGARGHLGGSFHPGHEFREHRGEAAAQRVIHAAGAARADRETVLLFLRAGRCDEAERGDHGDQRRHHSLHASLLIGGFRDFRERIPYATQPVARRKLAAGRKTSHQVESRSQASSHHKKIRGMNTWHK